MNNLYQSFVIKKRKKFIIIKLAFNLKRIINKRKWKNLNNEREKSENTWLNNKIGLNKKRI